MTLQIGDEWLGVPVVQLDRVVLAVSLCPVPMALPEYLGLLDNGQELVPVMQLASDKSSGSRTANHGEQLVAILHVRGESVGLAIDRAGQLCTRYEVDEAVGEVPKLISGVPARRACTEAECFWLIDTDQLWQTTPTSRRSTLFTD